MFTKRVDQNRNSAADRREEEQIRRRMQSDWAALSPDRDAVERMRERLLTQHGSTQGQKSSPTFATKINDRGSAPEENRELLLSCGKLSDRLPGFNFNDL